MADSNQITLNPVVHTADAQLVLRDGTSGGISLGPASACRNSAGGAEGQCPLWDGHIINATFPPV
jgi:hypothetical protein